MEQVIFLVMSVCLCVCMFRLLLLNPFYAYLVYSVVQIINKVKITHQGQGHKSRSRLNSVQGQIKVAPKER